MFWVIQKDLFQENQRPAIVDTLEKFSIPYQAVTILKDNTLYPEVTHEGPIITNGSIMLSNIAIQRGWKPGSLLNDNFSYEVWYKHFREHLLNRDAVFTTIEAANPTMDKFFFRPLLDDKSFTGCTISLPIFNEWREKALQAKIVAPDTKILYAPVKQIGQEHRHYIVDGVVVSSSRYKLAGVPNQTSTVDPFIVAYATYMASIWQPARAFVLDTYLSSDGEIGIVEMGCICHAGFYQADVQKIIMTLDSMEGL
jgi:hypothetical protein